MGILQEEKRIFWRAIARVPGMKRVWLSRLRLLQSPEDGELRKAFKMMAEKEIRIRAELELEVEEE